MIIKNVSQIQEKTTQEDSMDNISIVIRNRNEGEYIGFAIQSCLDHFDKPEIIIVDNNSTDDSLQVVNLFKDRTTVKVITINDYTPGKSINLGAKHATNDTILVLSAHSQITKVDLWKVKQDLIHNIAVFGNQTPIYKGKKISKRYIWSHFTNNVTKNLYSKIEDRYFLHNAFCFYNREFLIENPMPEQYPGKEDRFWAKDMIDKNHNYLYDGTKYKCNHFYTSNGATWKGIG
jgi:glycosyltransferase involved in cell wall biosynthesis